MTTETISGAAKNDSNGPIRQDIGRQGTRTSVDDRPPAPGSIVFVHPPERYNRGRPQSAPRICVVLGIQPNPDPDKAPLVMICPGDPLYVEDHQEPALFQRTRSDFVMSDPIQTMAAGLPARIKDRKIIYRFDLRAATRMEWTPAFKRLDQGGSVLGNLGKPDRKRISSILNLPREDLHKKPVLPGVVVKKIPERGIETRSVMPRRPVQPQIGIEVREPKPKQIGIETRAMELKRLERIARGRERAFDR